jgi:hypothetical protein
MAMRHPDPFLILYARIEARATLWRIGEIDSVEQLMRPIYGDAKRYRIFDGLGGYTGLDFIMLDALSPDGPK